MPVKNPSRRFNTPQKTFPQRVNPFSYYGVKPDEQSVKDAVPLIVAATCLHQSSNPELSVFLRIIHDGARFHIDAVEGSRFVGEKFFPEKTLRRVALPLKEAPVFVAALERVENKILVKDWEKVEETYSSVFGQMPKAEVPAGLLQHFPVLETPHEQFLSKETIPTESEVVTPKKSGRKTKANPEMGKIQEAHHE